MKNFYSIITCAALSVAITASAQTATLSTASRAVTPSRVTNTVKMTQKVVNPSDLSVIPVAKTRMARKAVPAMAKKSAQKGCGRRCRRVWRL